jgi:hypothetical protein
MWLGLGLSSSKNAASLGPPAPDLLSGADGALSLNGTTAYIDAGDIKRYSSMSIINNGQLIVRGYSLGFYVNNGSSPTAIGCSGNCTINTGGKIVVKENALEPDDFGGPHTFNLSLPWDSAVATASYSITQNLGGYGGETNGGGGIGGSDYATTGHGSGAGALNNGGNADTIEDWGVSGYGGDGTAAGLGGGGSWPVSSGFSFTGEFGTGGETGSGISVGGGGAGGGRGAHGGCLYLQVEGTLSVNGVVIDASGSNGGVGGEGGAADTPDDFSFGGGSGGGGAGGSGGKVIVRYKLGAFVSGNCNVAAGVGGVAGNPGIGIDNGFGAADGLPGGSGSNGNAGSTDIATY